MKITNLLATAAVVVAMVGLTPSPAAAAYSDCPNGYGCLWTSQGGNGSKFTISRCGVTHNMFDGWRQWNNEFESVINKGGGTIHLYDGYNRAGAYLGGYVNNGIGYTLPPENRNRVSSLYVDC